MARSTASIANEWRALGAQRSDKDAFVRMLAGMDQPSTGYDTPALQGTTAKDQPPPRYNTDPKDAAIYKAQQNWRGIGEAALGVGDVTNDYLNAGIRDIGWLVGNNEPYQFPHPSEAAANLAADWTDTPNIDASKLPPSVQQEAANSRAMYGMIPTDVTDAATSAAKMAMLIGPKSKLWNPELAALAERMHGEGASLDDIWKATAEGPVTGTTRSAGGHWKQEIPDIGTSFNPPADYADKGDWFAGDVFNHPLGYEAYPELAGSEFAWRDLGQGTKGQFRGMDETGDPRQVTINPYGGNPRSTMLHENFSHGAQDIEGWEKGGNTSTLRPGTPAWDIYQKRLKESLTPMSREAFYAESGPGGPDFTYEEYLKQTQNMSPKIRSIIDRAAQESAVEEAYGRNAAEAEARAVQTRSDMTPEQLREKPFHRSFDVPLEEQIVKERAAPGETFSAKGDPDDPFFHDVSGIKLDRPIDQMTAEYSPENLPVAKKTIEPQSMLGGVMLPLPGDRTIAGRKLLGINGEPLDQPVNLTGGPDFMRAEQQAGPDRAAWASGGGEISTIAGRVRKAEQEANGGDVYLGYMPMAIPGMDFSDMMTRAIRERMKGAKVKADDITAFNDEMKTWRGSLNKKTGQWEYPETPDFPGVEDIPDEWIATMPGVQRRKLAQLMDKSLWNKKGYPHIGPIRNALTEPGLRDLKSGTMGYSFAKADPGGRIITNPELPHGTYDTQLGGEYVGGFDTPIPKEVMFSTWYGGESDANKANPSQLDYSFKRKKPIQRLDDQWLENIMRHLEAMKRG